MTKIFKNPSIFLILLSRLLHDKSYNKHHKYFFTIEDYRRLMLIKKLIKPCTGKYKTIRYDILVDKSYKQLSGCFIGLYCKLEEETLFETNTSEDSFKFGNVNYYIKEDGLYTDNENNLLFDKIKKRNKLEKSYK